MDEKHRHFFYFLRLGLWGEADGPCPEGLSEDEWEELFRLSREQAVSGVWVDGVAQTVCRPSERLWAQFVRQAVHIGQMNLLLQDTEKRWLNLLKEQGIEAEVFKGSSVGCWYRKPLMRSYGDIDLVVWKGWEKLADWLHANGYQDWREGESLLDGKVTVEWHPCREKVCNPWVDSRLQRMLAADRRGLELYVACLILHLRRHVLSYGIGLKQVCDVAVIIRRAPMDRSRLAAVLRDLHVETFSSILFGLIERWMGSGFDFPLPPRRGKTVDLLERVVFGEGYHLKREREALSARRRMPGRVLGNACFWIRRAVRLCRLVPGESFFFIYAKCRERIGRL